VDEVVETEIVDPLLESTKPVADTELTVPLTCASLMSTVMVLPAGQDDHDADVLRDHVRWSRCRRRRRA